MTDLGHDRRHAWKMPSIVLRKLRDLLPADAAGHLMVSPFERRANHAAETS